MTRLALVGRLTVVVDVGAAEGEGHRRHSPEDVIAAVEEAIDAIEPYVEDAGYSVSVVSIEQQ